MVLFETVHKLFKTTGVQPQDVRCPCRCCPLPCSCLLPVCCRRASARTCASTMRQSYQHVAVCLCTSLPGVCVSWHQHCPCSQHGVLYEMGGTSVVMPSTATPDTPFCHCADRHPDRGLLLLRAHAQPGEHGGEPLQDAHRRAQPQPGRHGLLQRRHRHRHGAPLPAGVFGGACPGPVLLPFQTFLCLHPFDDIRGQW